MLAKKKNITTNFLALALGVISFSAQADKLPSARVSIGDFSYQLLDLNPTDGIAPSLTFSGDGFYPRRSESSAAIGFRYFTETYADRLTGPGATGLDRAEGSAHTVATGTTISAQSSVAPNAYGSEFGSRTFGVQDFVLSADTQVMFFATTSLSVSNSNTMGSAWATGTFRGMLSTPFSDPTHQSGFSVDFKATDSQDFTTRMVGVMSSFNMATSGSVIMEVETDSTWDATVPASLAPSVSAVPEPGTYAMLLAGLGLVGFAARRKRANAR